MTDFLNTEALRGSVRNPPHLADRVSTTIEAHNAFDDRVIELFDIAEDEGISIDFQSLNDFRKFIDSFHFIKPGALFLLDDGQVNLVWTDHGASGRVSIVFLGYELGSFAIIRYWGDEQKSSIVATDKLRNMMQHVEAHRLQHLLVP